MYTLNNTQTRGLGDGRVLRWGDAAHEDVEQG